MLGAKFLIRAALLQENENKWIDFLKEKLLLTRQEKNRVQMLVNLRFRL